MSQPTAIERLACFVAEHRFRVDDALRGVVRDSVIDTLGCILAGAQEQPAVLARQCFAALTTGGVPVYGTSTATAPDHAAMLNAIAGHALDMDDWEIPGNSHASVVMLPALLAAREATLPGEGLVDAYIAGFEVTARLGEAINFEHYARGWHTTGTLAAIGAAAAVSRLWRLNRQQAANALSLAVSRAAGLTRQFGSHAKSLQAGFACQSGYSAARMARAGLGGQAHVLEGRQGYFALTGHDDRERHEAALGMLGGELALAQHGQVIKPYPSCGYTHRVIDCARQLFARGLDPRRVQSINIELPDFHAEILPFEQPEGRREALFSLPFCCAMGLLQGDLTLRDLDAEAWNEESVRRLIAMTRVRPFAPTRPELNYDPRQPDRLSLRLDDGSTLEASVPYPRGAPQNRLSLDEILAKFATNAARLRPLQAVQFEKLSAWPVLDDVLPLFDSLGALDEP